MKRRDASLAGFFQRLTHGFLTRVENSRVMRGYASLWRQEGFFEGMRSRSVIHLDAPFVVSLMFHLLFLLLLAWMTITPKPSLKPGPIVVNILDQGRRTVAKKSVKKTPTQTKRAAKPKSRTKSRRVVKKTTRAPTPRKVTVPKAVPKTVPKAVPKVVPKAMTPKPLPLPTPKVLAQSPAENVAALSPAAEPLVQLPTSQSRNPIDTKELALAAGTATDVSADLTEIPRELLRGESTRGRGSAAQTATRADVGVYLKVIQERVKALWRYPDGLSGAHRVNFSIVLDESGKLVSVRVLDSTHPALKTSAMNAMKTASPFPPIPANLQWLAGEPIRLKFDVRLGSVR